LNFCGRGQGQGLDIQGRGQARGLENWSSRTRTFLEDNNTDVDVFPSQTNLSMANVVTCECEDDENIVQHEIS